MTKTQHPDTSPTPFEPQPVRIIRDLETLRVLTDPLRMRILAALDEQPRTVKEVARMLDMPPTRLYYHFNLLEKHGIIRVVETRVVSGIIEKKYRVTARNFNVDRALFAPTAKTAPEGWSLVLTGLVDRLRENVLTLIETGVAGRAVQAQDENGPIMHMSSSLARLTPAQAREFYARLKALMDEFRSQTEGEEGAEEYVLFLAFYPLPRQKDDTSSTPQDS